MVRAKHVSRVPKVLSVTTTSVVVVVVAGMIGCFFAPLFQSFCDAFSPVAFQRDASSSRLVVNAQRRPSTTTTTSAASAVIFSSTALSLDSSDDDNNNDDNNDSDPSKQFTSLVLQQVYPALVQHTKEHGHPNIPLGSKEGKQCQTLRRLHIQQKLTDFEMEILTSMGFRWHSLEDVYRTADFDDLYQRLLLYYQQHGTFDPPKKYAADPELGAWVTGIRRLGPQQLSSEQHYAALNALPEPGFRWVSTRTCGSAFMKQYREIQSRLEEKKDNDVWNDQAVQKWVKAQQLAVGRGDLSETRQHYMEQLLGAGWNDWKP